jgi:hypothetical protein
MGRMWVMGMWDSPGKILQRFYGLAPDFQGLLISLGYDGKGGIGEIWRLCYR